MNVELKERLKKLQPLAAELDSIAIVNFESSPDPSFFYFTNSAVNGVFYYDFRTPLVLTSALDMERAGKSWCRAEKYSEKFFAGIGKTGVNKKRISAAIFEKMRSPADISSDLEKIRSMKTNYEIRQLTRACRITARLWPKIESEFSGKLSEIGLRGIIYFLMSRKGCEPSFPTIVAAGKNSRFPHHTPTKSKLKEPTVIDFGLRYNGYCSDMARTIGSQHEKMLEHIIEEAEQMIAPGTKAADVDRLVRQRLGKEEKHFIHGLGHGIGVEVHEKPTLSKGSHDVLAPGMVFTIEPGVYKKEGIRIENDYLLTEEKLICLTK